MPYGVVEQDAVLRHQTDGGAQRGLGDAADVLAVDANGAGADVEEPAADGSCRHAGLQCLSMYHMQLHTLHALSFTALHALHRMYRTCLQVNVLWL